MMKWEAEKKDIHATIVILPCRIVTIKAFVVKTKKGYVTGLKNYHGRANRMDDLIRLEDVLAIIDKRTVKGKLQVAREVLKLPTIEPEPQWIPCSERMPEPRVDVWVCSDIGQIQGYYEEHVDVWYASFGQGRDYLELIVNAWMPLPEPWKGENNG